MKVRIIAGVVLLPLLLLLVLFAPKICTAILFGLMAAIGAYELLHGTGLVKELRLNIYSMVMALWTCLWCGLDIGYAWLLLGVLVYSAPIAFSMGASQTTSNIFKSWCRMFGGQVFLLVMNAWCLRLFTSMVGTFIANPLSV